MDVFLENPLNDSFPSTGNSSSSSKTDYLSSEHVIAIVISSVIAAVIVFTVVSWFYTSVNYIIVAKYNHITYAT